MTASYVELPVTYSQAFSASLARSASYIVTAQTASFVNTARTASNYNGSTISVGVSNTSTIGGSGAVIGNTNNVSGFHSIAIGSFIRQSGGSTAISIGEAISGSSQKMIIGRYNRTGSAATFIVGSGQDESTRSNAIEVFTGTAGAVITGSLFGTSSWAANATLARSASFITGSNVIGTVTTATTASYVDLTTGSSGLLTVKDLLKADYLATANYVDDTAAAAAGIPINGVYRTGNMLVVRLA